MLGTGQNIKRSLGRLASSQLKRQAGRVSVVSIQLREKTTVSKVFSKQVIYGNVFIYYVTAVKTSILSRINLGF